VIRQPCSPRMVGRTAELDRLRSLVADVPRTGGIALVVGEAGVGKSRLVREALAVARDTGIPVLTGRSVRGSDAYRPLVEALAGALRDRPVPADEALRPYLPALASLIPDIPLGSGVPPGRVVLGEAVLRLITALTGASGAVLVLEDLHWADPDTLEVLTYLAHAAVSSRLLLLLTARDEDDGVRALLDLVSSCSAPLIELGRLGEAEVRGLIESCLSVPPPDQLVDFVVASADGVPFLVEELLSGLAAAGTLDGEGQLTGPLTPNVPRTFAATVRQRLDSLPSTARRVVEAAAVVGRRFDWRLLPNIASVSDVEVMAGLRGAVSAGLVEPEEADTFRFRHALTCDAVRAELLPPDRMSLSRAAAEAVERAMSTSTELAASLWEAGGADDRAAELYQQAGQQARQRGALQSAELLLTRAAMLAADAPSARRVIERALLDVRAARGDTERALELGNRLLAEGETSVRLTLAEVAVDAGRWDLAAAQLAVEPDDGSPRTAVLVARIAHDRGSPDEARAAADKALALALEAGSWPIACQALEVVGRAARLLDLPAARAAFEQAERLALDHDLAIERISALHERGTIDLLLDGSTELLEEARALAEGAGVLGVAATLDVQIAAALSHRDPIRSLDYARTSAELAQRLRMDRLRATALFFAAAAHAHCRDTAAMERDVAQAIALAPKDLDVNAGIWGAVRAHVALLEDDRAALAACLDSAMDYLRRSATTAPAPIRGLWALIRTLDDRDGDTARAEVQPAAVNWENRALLGYAEAVAAGRDGQPAEASRAFAAADELMSGLPWWQHRLRLLVADDARSACWGDPAQWVKEALPAFLRRGDVALAVACRRLLRLAGEPVPRSGRGTTPVPERLQRYGVTSREMDVLALAGAGSSDADIARQLFLSPRTVETHMGSLRRKTGVADRAQLMALAKSGCSIR